MAWIATNSVKMPMNDTPYTPHTKDKMPNKAMIGMGKKTQFYPGNIALRVFQ